MMYLDDERLAWAKATGDHDNDASVDLHKDCNGNLLQTGDTVVLIKSLDVKGSTLNAKMGIVVKKGCLTGRGSMVLLSGKSFQSSGYS